MDKRLNLLGLAQVSGQLVSGQETVLAAIRSRQAKLVVLASDAGQSTKKKYEDKCQYYQIPINEDFSKEEISRALGRKRTVCAFLDSGFVHSFNKQN